MAVLYITGFAKFEQIADVSSETEDQTVAIGETSISSKAFNAATRTVRLHADAPCSVAFGASPVAADSMQRMAAHSTEYFSVPEGASWKVAVIANT